MRMCVGICGPHHTCGGQRTTCWSSSSHEGPGDGTQVGRFGSKCSYCWSILPASICYVALVGLIGHVISNVFPPQKRQLPRVPGLTFVASPSVVYCHCMNMAGFQGPGMQRARDPIKLAQDVFLSWVWGAWTNGAKWRALGKAVWLTEAVVSRVLKLYCPWLTQEDEISICIPL